MLGVKRIITWWERGANVPLVGLFGAIIDDAMKGKGKKKTVSF